MFVLGWTNKIIFRCNRKFGIYLVYCVYKWTMHVYMELNTLATKSLTNLAYIELYDDIIAVNL